MFLGFYVRKQIYWFDVLFKNKPIIRFICKRLNPILPGTHRTFSLLPCPLIPYSQYSIPSALVIAEALAANNGNANQTVKMLDREKEEMNPNLSTIVRIGGLVHKAIEKLDRLSQDIKENIGWRIDPSMSYRDVLSTFTSLINNYQNRKASDLAYDYFALFQKDVPYMQREFLFGTPSQLLF
jgi:hypothetical protein